MIVGLSWLSIMLFQAISLSLFSILLLKFIAGQMVGNHFIRQRALLAHVQDTLDFSATGYNERARLGQAGTGRHGPDGVGPG